MPGIFFTIFLGTANKIGILGCKQNDSDMSVNLKYPYFFKWGF